MRRWHAATAAIAVLSTGLALVGCSRDDEAEQLSGNLLIWVDEARAESIGDLARQWGEGNGVEVTVAQVGFDDMVVQFPAAVEQGDGPDIVLGANDWAGIWNSDGLLEPVDLGDNRPYFNTAAVEGFTIDGQVYGVPIAVENVVLLRNTSLAPEAPATVEQMAETGLALKTEGKVDFPIGINIGEAGDAYTSYPLFSSTGGYFFDGPDDEGNYDINNVGIDSTGGLEFASRWAALAGQGAIASSFTEDAIRESWADGRVAYWITGPWNAGAVESSRVPFSVEPVPGWQGASYPAVPIVSAQGFMRSTDSGNPPAADAFLRSLMSTDAMDAIYEANPRPPAWLESAAKHAEDPVVGPVLAAGDGGFPNLPYPQMTIVYEEAGLAQKRIADGADPAAEMQAAQERIDGRIAAGG